MSKITSINIGRGCARKKALIQHLVYRTKPDIILLQETNRASPKIDGYTTYSQTSITGETVGIATLIRNNIKHSLIDLSRFVTPGTELLGITVPINGNRSNLIVNCYIASETINTVKIRELLTSHKNALLFGDLNSKLDIPEHNRTNVNGEKLQTSIDKGHIAAVYPSTYTRRCLKTSNPNSSSILDFVLLKEEEIRNISTIYTEEDIGSDHLPVTLHLKTKPMRTAPITTRKPNFDKADWESYRNHMEEKMALAPEINPNKNSIDQAITFITTAIKDCDSESIPRVKVQPNGSRPLPPHIIKLIKERKEFLKIKMKIIIYHLNFNN